MAPASVLCDGPGRAFARLNPLWFGGTPAPHGRYPLSSDLPSRADAARFRSRASEISCANAVSRRHELSHPAIAASEYDVAAGDPRHMEHIRSSICPAGEGTQVSPRPSGCALASEQRIERFPAL